MTYEELLIESDEKGLIVKEKPLQYHDGRIKGNRVAIRNTIPTTTQKACVLSEEIAHHVTSTGDILDMSKASNRKQEMQARLYSCNKMIGLRGLIEAFERHCSTRYEIADYLGVTEEFLLEALQLYQSKYGKYKIIYNYLIEFNYPNIGIIKKV